MVVEPLQRGVRLSAPSTARHEPFGNRRRRVVGRTSSAAFAALAIGATAFGVAALALLLFTIARDGLGGITLGLPDQFPVPQARTRRREGRAAWHTLGHVLHGVVLHTPGRGRGNLPREFAPRNWLTRLIEINISTLAGVPSVVYGLLGLALFVYGANLGPSIISAACTLTLLILPIIIVASREGLRSVPVSMREAAMALGATRWQAIWHQVLPAGMPAVLTGVILALGRAIGETAPLIAIGAFTSVFFVPTSPMDSFTVLPIQVFSWLSRPLRGFQENAAAGIVILLAVLLLLNSVAVALRHMYGKRSQ